MKKKHISAYHFSNSIYTYRCRNKYLEFDRNSAVMTDSQLVKIQELNESEEWTERGGEGGVHDTLLDSSGDGQEDPFAAARVPRTFEMELRGGDLVETCAPGDAVLAVGIVKSVQVCVYECASV